MARISTFILFLLITITLQAQENYYWVGGGGNWNDINHWSKSSGNTGNTMHDVVPSSIDNVYFDANSGFTATNNTVTLDGLNSYCNNMTWSGTTNNPKLIGTGSTLHIGGNLELQSGMTYEIHETNFTSNNPAGTTITTNGVFLKNRTNKANNFTGSSNYTITDKLSANALVHNGTGNLTFNDAYSVLKTDIRSSGITTFKGNILVKSSDYYYGSFSSSAGSSIIASNITITIDGKIYLGGVSADISNSTINVKGVDTQALYYERVTTLTTTNSNINLDIVRDDRGSPATAFVSTTGKAYNNIAISRSSGSNYETKIKLSGSSAHTIVCKSNKTILEGDNNTITNLTFKKYGIIKGTGNTFNTVLFEKAGSFEGNNAYNNLTLSSGEIYTFRAGTTQTVNQNFTANAPPCTGIIELKSNTPGTQATLHFATGSTITANGLKIQDIKATGNIPVVANNSFDSGNNTGFTINQVVAQNLYWIGGNGNWNTPTNWTTDPNGASTGGCVPTPADNVFFNANSGFTATNNTVTLDGPNSYCNNMTWSGTTNNPKLIGTGSDEALYIGGNLELESGITYKVDNTYLTSNHPAGTTIKTNGVVMAGGVITSVILLKLLVIAIIP